MVSWPVTGVDLQTLHADTFLARYRYRSTINRSQICPVQIQVSNRELQTVGRDSFPGWIQVQTSDLRLKGDFLARYRYLSSNSSCRYFPGYLQVQIYNQSLTDMPWLDTGIESGTSKGWSRQLSWLDTGIDLQSIAHGYALARYRYQIWNFKRLIEIAFLVGYRRRPL